MPLPEWSDIESLPEFRKLPPEVQARARRRFDSISLYQRAVPPEDDGTGYPELRDEPPKAPPDWLELLGEERRQQLRESLRKGWTTGAERTEALGLLANRLRAKNGDSETTPAEVEPVSTPTAEDTAVFPELPKALWPAANAAAKWSTRGLEYLAKKQMQFEQWRKPYADAAAEVVRDALHRRLTEGTDAGVEDMPGGRMVGAVPEAIAGPIAHGAGAIARMGVENVPEAALFALPEGAAPALISKVAPKAVQGLVSRLVGPAVRMGYLEAERAGAEKLAEGEAPVPAEMASRGAQGAAIGAAGQLVIGEPLRLLRARLGAAAKPIPDPVPVGPEAPPAPPPPRPVAQPKLLESHPRSDIVATPEGNLARPEYGPTGLPVPPEPRAPLPPGQPSPEQILMAERIRRGWPVEPAKPIIEPQEAPVRLVKGGKGKADLAERLRKGPPPAEPVPSSAPGLGVPQVADVAERGAPIPERMAEPELPLRPPDPTQAGLTLAERRSLQRINRMVEKHLGETLPHSDPGVEALRHEAAYEAARWDAVRDRPEVTPRGKAVANERAGRAWERYQAAVEEARNAHFDPEEFEVPPGAKASERRLPGTPAALPEEALPEGYAPTTRAEARRKALADVDADLAVARETGQPVDDLIARRRLLLEDKPPIGGGAGLRDKARDAMRAVGFEPERAEVLATRSEKDVVPIVRPFVDKMFYVRKYPTARASLRTMLDATDVRDRLHYKMIERSSANGKTLTLDSPLPMGLDHLERLVPRGDTEAMEKLLWEQNAEGRWLSPQELAAKGADPDQIKWLGQYKKWMQWALTTINATRKTMNETMGTNYQMLTGLDGYAPEKWMARWQLVRKLADGTDEPWHPKGATTDAHSEAEAFAWARQAVKDAPDAAWEIRPKYYQQDLMGSGASRDGELLRQMLRMAEDRDTISVDDLRAAIAAGVTPKGFTRHFAHRSGKEGFEKNLFGEDGVLRAYATGMLGWATRTPAAAKVRYLMERDKTLPENVRKAMATALERFVGRPDPVTVALDDSVRAVLGPAITMTAKRAPKGMSDLAVRLGNRLESQSPSRAAVVPVRRVVADLKLGLFNIGGAIRNILGSAANVIPVTGEAAYAKGVRMAFAPDREAKYILSRLQVRGVLKPLFVRGEASQVSGGGRLRRGIEAMRTAGFAPFSGAEVISRRASALAFYYAAKAKGLDESRVMRFVTDNLAGKMLPNAEGKPSIRALTDVAQRGTELSNFRYDLASRPPVTTGPLGELTGQFRTYGYNQLGYWKRLSDLASHGDPAPLLHHLGALFAMAGLVGLPGAREMDRVVQWAWGVSPLDETWKRLPQWAQHGLPTLAGADVSSSITPEAFPRQFADVAGPAVGTAINLLHDGLAADYDMMARRTAMGPGSLYATIRLFRDRQMREPTTRARLQFTPEPRDIAVSAIGLKSAAQTQIQDFTRVAKRAKEAHGTAKAQLVDRLLAGDESARAEAQAQGIPITGEDLASERKKKQQDTVTRTMEMMPKAMRPKMSKLAESIREREQRARAGWGK